MKILLSFLSFILPFTLFAVSGEAAITEPLTPHGHWEKIKLNILHKATFLERESLKEKSEKQDILRTKNKEISTKSHEEKEEQINEYIFIIGLFQLLFVALIYFLFFVLKWQQNAA